MSLAERLDALRALLEDPEAVPVPWEVGFAHEHGGLEHETSTYPVEVRGGGNSIAFRHDDDYGTNFGVNAALAVAAVNALRDLLDIAERAVCPTCHQQEQRQPAPCPDDFHVAVARAAQREATAAELRLDGWPKEGEVMADRYLEASWPEGDVPWSGVRDAYLAGRRSRELTEYGLRRDVARLAEALKARLPWHELIEAGWTVAGLNHYQQLGMRHLFVSMTKRDPSRPGIAFCIKAEGTDETAIFADLMRQAKRADRSEGEW